MKSVLDACCQGLGHICGAMCRQLFNLKHADKENPKSVEAMIQVKTGAMLDKIRFPCFPLHRMLSFRTMVLFQKWHLVLCLSKFLDPKFTHISLTNLKFDNQQLWRNGT